MTNATGKAWCFLRPWTLPRLPSSGWSCRRGRGRRRQHRRRRRRAPRRALPAGAAGGRRPACSAAMSIDACSRSSRDLAAELGLAAALRHFRRFPWEDHPHRRRFPHHARHADAGAGRRRAHGRPGRGRPRGPRGADAASGRRRHHHRHQHAEPGRLWLHRSASAASQRHRAHAHPGADHRERTREEGIGRARPAPRAGSSSRSIPASWWTPSAACRERAMAEHRPVGTLSIGEPWRQSASSSSRSATSILADMEAGLIALRNGDGDPETINAVFRAVHSVKGRRRSSSSSTASSSSPTGSRARSLDSSRSDALEPTPEIVKRLAARRDVLVRPRAGRRATARRSTATASSPTV